MELGVVGVAFLSSWVTLALVVETEPIINEDGEEEYSTKGLIVLGGLYIIRLGINGVRRLLYGKRVVELIEPEASKETKRTDPKHELVI